MELKTLFSPGKIGNVEIKNRIVRSATYEKRATKYGKVAPELIDFLCELAKGGTGLIISGMIAVHPSGTGSQYGAWIYDDSFISGQRELTKAVHDCSEAKIAAQIAHTGIQGTNPKYDPIGPSPMPINSYGKKPRGLTAQEVGEVINWFVAATRRIYESDYDIVQLHAAHGYLLSNFVSPYSNKREDEFGGTPQKRAKILVEIYKGIRQEVDKNFPVTIKLQTNDFFKGGLELEEGKEIAKTLVDAGFDAIEPSGGSVETIIGKQDNYPSLRVKTPEQENYFLPIVKELKPIMGDCPIILMGGIKNPVSIEQILRDGDADFIAMCRPLINEPDLSNRWKSGDTSPAKCISCNSCYMTMVSGATHCVVRKRRERRLHKKEMKLNK
jgi:2,4-dienoyl-CoA reductase-like NADH-dependent reductase (Old Yellow Enzyme family)